jgi:anti-anti-sigma factor
VVIDLSPVSFLSSSGLSRLVDLGRRMSLHGGKVCLAAASRPVERLVRLVGLDQVMPYFGSVAEASAHLQAASPPP